MATAVAGLAKPLASPPAPAGLAAARIASFSSPAMDSAVTGSAPAPDGRSLAWHTDLVRTPPMRSASAEDWGVPAMSASCMAPRRGIAAPGRYGDAGWHLAYSSRRESTRNLKSLVARIRFFLRLISSRRDLNA